jgi:hypothetical protein
MDRVWTISGLYYKNILTTVIKACIINWLALASVVIYDNKWGGVKTERVFPWLSVLRKNNKMVTVKMCVPLWYSSEGPLS